MRRLMHWILDHPTPPVVFVLLVTLFLGSQLRFLAVDTSVNALMVQADPARDYYETVKETFGSDELTMVVLTADDVFTYEHLTIIDDLTDALGAVDGVEGVISLATVNNLKGAEDWVDTSPLLDGGPPEDTEELARIRRDALSNPALVGNVVSEDGTAAAVLVFAEPAGGDPLFDGILNAAVDEAVAEVVPADVNAYQVGIHHMRKTLGDYISGDQLRLVPLVTVILLGMLWLSFRSAMAVFIPLTTSFISIVWAMGWMGMMGYQVNILTSVVPLLLICIGFTEDVHMISEFLHSRRKGLDIEPALREMSEAMSTPILVTSFTTTVGFASLAATGVNMWVQLGQVAPVAFGANFIITIVVVPVLLRAWGERSAAAANAQATTGRLDGPLAALASFNFRHRRGIMVATFGVVVGALGLASQLGVDSDVVGYFRPSSEVRQRLDAVRQDLAGAIVFYLVVDTEEEGGAKDPEVLRYVDQVQALLAGTKGVDDSTSLADLMKTMHREMNGGDPEFFEVPDSSELVAQYLLMLPATDYEKYLDYDGAIANIMVRHSISSSKKMRELLDAIHAHAAEHAPRGVKVRETGEMILVNNSSDLMAGSLITGLSYTVLVVAVVNAMLFLSVFAGLLSIIPNLIPVALGLGFMHVIGFPLNPGTAIFAAIAVGIAVDDTIHYMCRYNMELDRHQEPAIAMHETITSEGSAIITTSLALAAGFLVLGWSNFVAIGQLGIVCTFVFVVALVVDLTVTPVLMSTTRLVTLWHIVALKMTPDLVAGAPLFHNMGRWEARKVVALGMLRSLAPGEHAVRQGEVGGEMFMVVSGTMNVEVETEGKVTRVAQCTPGDVFGEMALVDQMERSAGVVAETDVEVLVMDGAALDRLRGRFPFTAAKLFLNIAKILSSRLRRTTEAVVRSAS